jgi:hypothetical protein
MQDKSAFLEYFDFKVMPMVPQTVRPLDTLLTDGDAWSFSAEERGRLADHVKGKAKRELDEDMLVEFEVLAKKHEESRKRYAETRANVRVPRRRTR